MKIFCITSDKYRYLVAGFAESFNKWWSSNVQVFVLCYDKPNELLPSNFECISLGRQEDYKKSWTTALTPYFNKCEDDKILILLEDYWLNKQVKQNEINEALNQFEKSDVMKVELNSLNLQFGHSGNFEQTNFVIRSQQARYRTSLQAAIWKRNYFVRQLHPNWTAWDFELKGELLCMNDDALILAPKHDILSYDNMVTTNIMTKLNI